MYFKEDLTQALLVLWLSLQICPCHLRRRLVWLEVHRRSHFSDPVDYVTVLLTYESSATVMTVILKAENFV